MTLLLLQMRDSEVSGFSSNNLELEDSSWEADTIEWDYKSNETDLEMIFEGPMNSNEEMSLMGHEGWIWWVMPRVSLGIYC